MKRNMNLHRPVYHFMPPANWINDPNGPIYYDGKYHIFYQHNPYEDKWDNIHWGHAQSNDLINWEHLPLALKPSAEWGESHCFSGCAVVNDGVPTLIYTSICGEDGSQRLVASQRIAKSHDGMMTWQKEKKPVLNQEIHTERVMEWRDPFLWQENDKWNMLLGGTLNGYGCIFLYNSPDLYNWTYAGPMLIQEDVPFLECPNVLRFEDKSVLIYSPDREVTYHVGEITSDGSFLTEYTGILDHGGRTGFYAPNTLLNDPDDRYITWGWVPKADRRRSRIDGNSGALSLPRELSLSPTGRLVQRPVREIRMLRLKKEQFPYSLLSGDEYCLNTRGRALEIHLTSDFGSDDDFVLNLLQSPDGMEKTRIRFRGENRTVTLERAQTSLDNESPKTFHHLTLPESENQLDASIFLDHSIIEIFINDFETITARLYPTREDADTVSIEGLAAKISLEVWEMDSASFTMQNGKVEGA